MSSFFDKYLQIHQSTNKGNGVFSKIDIAPNTIICQVHQDNFITFDDLKANQYFQKIADSTYQKKFMFAVFLIYATKEGRSDQIKKIKKYCSTLPKKYSNLICWQIDQLKKIKNQTLSEITINKKNKLSQQLILMKKQLESKELKIKKQNQVFIETIKRGNRSYGYKSKQSKVDQYFNKILEQITLQQVTNMVAAIQSRNLHYPTGFDQKSEIGALIYPIEMFNHSNDSKCKVQQKGSYFQVITQRQIKKGEQIFVKYAQMSNHEYLQLYGMLPIQMPQKQQQKQLIKWLTEEYNKLYQSSKQQ